MLDFVFRITAIQETWRKSYQINKAKLTLLNLMWKKEHDKMQKYAFKTKSKKDKHLLRDLNSISDKAKKNILDSYLFRCSVKHSLAFFQWRSQFSAKTSIDDLESLFNERRFSLDIPAKFEHFIV